MFLRPFFAHFVSARLVNQLQGIGHMRGVVWENGWPWIFILEGIATVIIAIAAYWFIQNYPGTAKFISPAERRFIHQRLASDSDATHDERFTWGNVLEALKDVKCWLYGIGFHTMSLPLYTFSLFLVSRDEIQHRLPFLSTEQRFWKTHTLRSLQLSKISVMKPP
jgi:hypothetical protein